MTPDKTRLKAKARQLGIEGYRNMGLEDLQAAISEAENGGSTKGAARAAVKKATRPVVEKGSAAKPRAAKPAAKGKAAPKAEVVEKTDAATKTKVSKPAAKGKAAKTSTSAPAKSKTQKTQPAKGGAAKGTAKRPTTGSTKTTKVEPVEGDGIIRRNIEGGRVGKGGYTNIDLSKIDWGAETAMGQTGKRKVTLDSLRKHKGDNAAVFVELREHAVEWYPNALKAYPGKRTKKEAAEHQLRWFIARVRYDFVYTTGQHSGRATAKIASPVKAQTKGKAATTRKTATKAKPAGARRSAAKGKVAEKPARKPAAAQKPAGAVSKARSKPSARGRGALATKG